jgi:hypothetical protein
MVMTPAAPHDTVAISVPCDSCRGRKFTGNVTFADASKLIFPFSRLMWLRSCGVIEVCGQFGLARRRRQFLHTCRVHHWDKFKPDSCADATITLNCSLSGTSLWLSYVVWRSVSTAVLVLFNDDLEHHRLILMEQFKFEFSADTLFDLHFSHRNFALLKSCTMIGNGGRFVCNASHMRLFHNRRLN